MREKEIKKKKFSLTKGCKGGKEKYTASEINRKKIKLQEKVKCIISHNTYARVKLIY